jgi:Short C-terminal domain
LKKGGGTARAADRRVARPAEADVHGSTRILLLLAAMVAIVGGWWALFAINDPVPAIAYGVLWTVVVIIATRLLLALGMGYNRLTSTAAKGQKTEATGAAAALAELTDLRDRGLISAEEYEAKRAKILEGL